MDKRHMNCLESLKQRHKHEVSTLSGVNDEQDLTIATLKKTIDELTNIGKSD